MDVEYKKYTFQDSLRNIQESLKKTDKAFSLCSSISQGLDVENAEFQTVYADASVISVALNASGDLMDGKLQSALALGYKVIVSEIINIIKGVKCVKSCNVDAYHINAVFDTEKKSDYRELVDAVAKISSIIEIWNWEQRDTAFNPFLCAICLNYGKVLHFDTECKVHIGNNSVYMGEAISKSVAIASLPAETNTFSLVRATQSFYDNLHDDYKGLFKWNPRSECYQTVVYNVEMKNWLISKQTAK